MFPRFDFFENPLTKWQLAQAATRVGLQSARVRTLPKKVSRVFSLSISPLERCANSRVEFPSALGGENMILIAQKSTEGCVVYMSEAPVVML